jgi:DNA adenine methylase
MSQQPLLLISPASYASPVKWVGSKSWLAPSLVPQMLPLLADGATYHELFAGSAAVFFALRAAGFKGPAVLSDTCAPLMGLYQALQADAREVVRELAQLAAHERRVGGSVAYADLREEFQRPTHEHATPQRAALFLWINHRCFNGLYRENRDGVFNVAYGGERTHLPSADTLLAAEEALQNTRLAWSDWNGDPLLVPSVRFRDVVFADPPYDGTFTEYSGVFGDREQKQLAEQLKIWVEWGGVQVFATNADTPRMREFYAWASLETLATKYAVGGDRGEAKELLIRGVP